jgi:hypothetical protein
MRLNQFRQIELNWFGNNSFSPSPQNQSLLLELEHLYCSGAWLAVVAFSYAMIDIHLENIGLPASKREARIGYLSMHSLDDDVERLRIARNPLVHFRGKAKESEIVDVEKVIFERDKLYQNAKQAIQTTFRVVLLETRATPE